MTRTVNLIAALTFYRASEGRDSTIEEGSIFSFLTINTAKIGTRVKFSIAFNIRWLTKYFSTILYISYTVNGLHDAVVVHITQAQQVSTLNMCCAKCLHSCQHLFVYRLWIVPQSDTWLCVLYEVGFSITGHSVVCNCSKFGPPLKNLDHPRIYFTATFGPLQQQLYVWDPYKSLVLEFELQWQSLQLIKQSI